jgi:hypothetical protein
MKCVRDLGESMDSCVELITFIGGRSMRMFEFQKERTGLESEPDNARVFLQF